MDITLGKVLLVLIAAAIGYGFSRLGRHRDQKTEKVLSDERVAISEVKSRDLRIDELERHVRELQAKSDAQTKAAIPIEAAMQAMLIAKLTNEHLPEADALLKKATDGTLTPDDAIKFTEALADRESDMDPRIGEAQQLAAKILPDMIRLRQLAEKAPAGEVKTVMVTVPETETKAAADGGTQQEEKGN